MDNTHPDQSNPPARSPPDHTTVFDSQSPRDQDADLGFLQPPGRSDSLGRLGHYEVLDVLGRGGFGIVFRAFDARLERVVAIKVLSPEMASTSPARKRFLREARAGAQIRHENVVPIHVVEEQPLPYLVMDYIPGETLQDRLDRAGPLDAADVVAIGRQVAEGLAAAHAAGLIHRDVKPANILIEAGPRPRVRITDFGLARAADDASITQSGVVAGTPLYMSPEQARGDTLDHRTDLFSLGSVLYQMVSGRPPFRADTTLGVLHRVAEDTPRPIGEIIPEAPAWLCDLIARLHAKNPDDRFQSAREVADLLADCEATLRANRDVNVRLSAARPAAPLRRVKWAATAVVVLLLGLGLAEGVGLTHWFRGQRPADATKPGEEPAPPPTAKQGSPADERWVPLFNGRDLSGWKTVKDQPGDWRVENGVLVGSGPPRSHLFSERGDFRDFHVRLEVSVSDVGDSGLYFRSEFGASKASAVTGFRYPRGYEAQILGPGITNDNPTGSLVVGGGVVKVAPRSMIAAETWFTLEVIARDNHLKVRVNNRVTVDYHDESTTSRQGHFALQCAGGDRPTRIRVRKIEIMESPPN
jgi:hypothetical protein